MLPGWASACQGPILTREAIFTHLASETGGDCFSDPPRGRLALAIPDLGEKGVGSSNRAGEKNLLLRAQRSRMIKLAIELIPVLQGGSGKVALLSMGPSPRLPQR